jgi:hypothetical protein
VWRSPRGLRVLAIRAPCARSVARSGSCWRNHTGRPSLGRSPQHCGRGGVPPRWLRGTARRRRSQDCASERQLAPKK